MVRYPNGVEGDFFHQKRVPSAPGLRRGAVRRVPERPLDRLRRDRQRGRARVGRQPRLHRAAHLALARRGHRAAGLSADRPRPDDRRAVAVRSRDRARRARRDGGARARRLSEDVGRDRSPHPRADQARGLVPRSATLREGARARRSSGGSATRRSRRRRGESPTGAVCSSTSARTRATGRSRPRTPSARRPTRASLRRSAGTRWRPSSLPTFTVETMRERVADVGDLTADMWRRKVSLLPRFPKLGLEYGEPNGKTRVKRT